MDYKKYASTRRNSTEALFCNDHTHALFQQKGETNIVSETISEKYNFKYIGLGNSYNFI